MEAAASGLPVLARKDYEPESVMDGTTGFLAGDDHEMMLSLGRLLADRNLRRKFGEFGRTHVARFSWDVITRQWETIFSRLAAAQRKGSTTLIPKLVIVTEIIAPYRIPVLNALARRAEIELEVIFLSENDPSLREWKVYKDEIKFNYRVLPSWRQRLGRYNVLINRGVNAALSGIKPNVILCGGYNYLASWSTARWAGSHRVPLLLWSESTAWDRRRGYPLVEFMKKRFLKLCAAFVVPGRSSFEYLTDLGIAPQRIFTAPNAVDTALFSNLAETARRNESQVRSRYHLPSRYFLYVGRLVKDKGVFDLLEAYAQLEAEIRCNVGLVFAGTGSDSRKLVERAG